MLPRTALFLSGCVDHSALHPFPTRRSSDLLDRGRVLEPTRHGSQPPVCACCWRRCLRSRDRQPCWRLRRCDARSEEHTSELQSRVDLVCRLLLEKKKNEG